MIRPTDVVYRALAIALFLLVSSHIARSESSQQVEIESKFLVIPAGFDLGADFTEGKFGLRSIYSEAKFQEFVRAISTKKKADLMSAPKLDIPFGKKGVVHLLRERPLPEASKEQSAAGGSTESPVDFEKRNLGATFEIHPVLNSDGTVALAIESNIVEGSMAPPPPTILTSSIINQPIFSTRLLPVAVNLRFGETAIIRLPTGERFGSVAKVVAQPPKFLMFALITLRPSSTSSSK